MSRPVGAWLLLLLMGSAGRQALAAPHDPADFVSIAPLLDPDDDVLINTATLELTVKGGPTYDGELVAGVAVFTFDEVLLDEAVEVIGSHPVALLSKGSLIVRGRLRANASGPTGGPGGHDGGQQTEGESGQGPGGGQGSSDGASGGGFGGRGGDYEDLPGGQSYGDLSVRLEGGSGGGRGDSPGYDGVGGGGGGAVELGAASWLVLEPAGRIEADGADGEPPTGGDFGGGGGAGGGVLLHAPEGRCEGKVHARGGDAGNNNNAAGGGGGGRVLVLGLDAAACDFDVRAGRGGGNGSPGQAGDVQIASFSGEPEDPDPGEGPDGPPGDGTDAPPADSEPPPVTGDRPPAQVAVGTGVGCGCRSGRPSGAWLALLGLLLARRRPLPT